MFFEPFHENGSCSFCYIFQSSKPNRFGSVYAVQTSFDPPACQQILHKHIGMQIRPSSAADAKICFDHLMPGENRRVGVTISCKCAQVHNVIHTVSLGRIDQCFALHKHVNCIASYKKDSRDVFQCLIEGSWIIEIDE